MIKQFCPACTAWHTATIISPSSILELEKAADEYAQSTDNNYLDTYKAYIAGAASRDAYIQKLEATIRKIQLAALDALAEETENLGIPFK